MHLAHELLEALNPDAPEYGLVMRAVKFDLGDYDEISRLSEISTQTFFRPPFPVCLFQVGESDYMHIFLSECDGEFMNIVCYYKSGETGMRWDECGIRLRIRDDGRWLFFTRDGKNITQEVKSKEEYLQWGSKLMTLAISLEAFSCCNVVQVEHAGPKLINAKRLKKGKPPIFSYRTLHITGEGVATQAGQGDRNSPRLHLRRGHIRTLPDGRKIWVRSAVVGAKAGGFIHKDYAVNIEKPGVH